MRLILVKILIFMLMIPSGMSAQNRLTDPLLNGPSTPCEGSTENFYSTDPGQGGYLWVVSSGGTITSGDGTQTIKVTWKTGFPPGQTVKVSYIGSNVATMNVLVTASLPVSASIVPSANPACAGTLVTYVITPVNGGTAPAFQWQVNGINIAGATNGTYAFIPANGSTVACILTSNEVCVTNNPALSNTVTMSVNPLVPAGVSIAASTNPSCIGATVNFNATTFNGGTSPTYKWKINNIDVPGATNAFYSFIPADHDKVLCILTSNATCVSANPATSNEINMNVGAAMPVSVSITASETTTCPGNLVVFAAVPTNGGLYPVYTWFVNGIPTGSNSPGFSYTPVSGDIVTCELTSSAVCTLGNPALSNAIPMTVEPYAPVSISIVPSANPACNGVPVTFTATAVNGGASPVFQWLVNGAASGPDNSEYTYIPTQGDVVICQVNSSALCATGNPAISNAISMTVSPTGTPEISIISSLNPVCQGTLVTFTATPLNGGTAPTYQWNVNGMPVGSSNPEFSYFPVNLDVVTCVMNSNSVCSPGTPVVSNQIAMSVVPVSNVGVSIVAESTNVCIGSDVEFIATTIYGGTSPFYQWKVNGGDVGTNSPTFHYQPNDNDVVTCILTSNALCAAGNPTTSNPVTMTVNESMLAGVTIVASSPFACTDIPVLFTAIPVNGGTNPVYEWWINNVHPAGATNSTYSYSSNTNYTVQCILTSNNGCPQVNVSPSNEIQMTVNPMVTASVSIAASANPSCQGAFTTYTATPVNGGTTPVYQWKVNGLNRGSNIPTYTYAPVSGDIVTCQLTTNAQCAVSNQVSSNVITMTVDPYVTATITVTTPNPVVCPGTQVTFTAGITNGGANPVYQWYLNGTATGTNASSYTLTPGDGDKIKCRLTSSLTCLSGNPVTSSEYTIHTNSPLPGAISISASANPFCQGSIINFTSAITNGGTSPIYKWRVNGVEVGNLPSYSYAPANGDYVACQLISSLTCTAGPVTSNAILMQVKTISPVSVNIVASDNPVCQNSNVTFVATAVNGGSSPAYQWLVDGGEISGATSVAYNFVPVNGNSVTCRLTSSATCVSGNPAVSSPVIMTVSPGLPVNVFISTATNPFCQGTVVTFNAKPVNGGSAPDYAWSVNGIGLGTGPTFSYGPSNNDAVTCMLTSNSGCISGSNQAVSNEIVMSEATSLPASVTITASVNPACQGTPVTMTATPVNGGNTPSYQWIVGVTPVPGATNSTYTFIPFNGNVVVCRLTSSLDCASGSPALSDPLTIIVTSTVFPSVSIAPSINPVCTGALVTFTALPVNGGPSPVYKWRVNGIVAEGATNSTYTYNPLNYDAVTCQLTSNISCNSGIPVLSNQVAMVVKAEQAVGVIITTQSLSFCAGTSVTFTASPVNGGTSPSYQWKVGGFNGIGTSTNSTYTYPPNNGDVVTCVMTSNQTCISNNPATSNSLLMTAGTGFPVSVSISASINPICQGDVVIFTAVPTYGGNPQYQWKVNGVNKGTGLNMYQYQPAVGDWVTCTLTSSLTGCVVGNPATSNTINMIVNPTVNVSVVVTASANPSCIGSSVCYYAAVTNAGTFARYRWKVNGIVVNSMINNPSFCYVPNNGDVVSCQVASDVQCATPFPCNSNEIPMTVLPISNPAVVVSAPANLVCQGTPVTFTAITSHGGSAPVYQWKVNTIDVIGATNVTYAYEPSNNDQVSNQLTSNENCVSQNVVVSPQYPITVSPNVPVSVSIAAFANPVCLGSPATFFATPVNGGSMPAYQWLVNGQSKGINSFMLTYIPAEGDVVTCELTSNKTCATGSPAISNSITVSVIETLVVGVSIGASATPPCQGQSITYTALAENGGLNPQYQWLVNGMFVGSNSPVYTYVPSSGDAVTCYLTSDLSCTVGNPAMSNTISMIFPPYVPVSVFINCSANPACEGIPSVFTAIPVNGGSGPLYQWKNKGINISGATSQTYSCFPVNGDIITCRLSSSETCANNNPATSNSITMSVLEIKTPSVSIVPSENPACEGNEVTLTAFPINGGSTPAYRWFKNNIDMGIGPPTYTFLPVNGDEIYCQLTTSLTCVTQNNAISNSVTIEVASFFTPTVTINANPYPACDNQPVLFTATPQNGGDNPVYQWTVNGFNVGINSPAYSYIPTAGDEVNCQLASSYSCATTNMVTSNEILMTVNPLLTAGISIEPTANPVCTGTIVGYTATAVNGGLMPVYEWKLNGGPVAGATNASYSYIPSDNDVISCDLTSSEMCVQSNHVESNAIPMMVAASFAVSVEIATLDNPVCVGTVSTFTATPANGGNSPDYKWFVNNIEQVGETQPTFTFLPSHGDFVQCFMTSQFSCGVPNTAGSNSITMQVLATPVSVTITAFPAGAVCQEAFVEYTSHPVNGGTIPTYQWNVDGVAVSIVNNPTANSPIFIYAPSNGESITCTLNSNAACVLGNTVTSLPIIAMVNPNLPVDVQISASPGNTICSGTSVIFSSNTTNGGTMPAYQWYLNGVLSGGETNPTYTITPVDEDYITCILTSSEVCQSGGPASSNTLTINVNPLLPVTLSMVADPPGQICSGIPIKYTVTPGNGGVNPIYVWTVDGVVVGGNLPEYTYIPANNDLVKCTLTSGITCVSGNPATSSMVVALDISPVVTYSACNDLTTTTNAKPFKLRGGLPLNGVYSGPGVLDGTGIFNPDVNAIMPNPAVVGPNQIRYTYTTAGQCEDSKTIIIDNRVPIPVNCTGPGATSMVDIRDNNKVYPIVQLGTQCWFAKNLNYGARKNSSGSLADNCVNEKYCLNNSETNCDIYGGLYQWDELMRYDPAMEGHQGICPPGWHVPTEAEWGILFNYYGGKSQAGTPLKEIGAGSFNALLGGVLYQNYSLWSFFPPNAGANCPPEFAATFFWTSDAYGQWQVKSHGLNNAVESVSDYLSKRGNAMSVRCLRD